jgi:hypothetical protein
MTVTTIRAATRPREARPLTRRIDRYRLRLEVLELTAAAAMTAVVGAMVPAVGIGFVVSATTGSGKAFGAIAGLSGPFLAVTSPMTAIWLLGAIQTRRAIRCLRASDDRGSPR